MCRVYQQLNLRVFKQINRPTSERAAETKKTQIYIIEQIAWQYNRLELFCFPNLI